MVWDFVCLICLFEEPVFHRHLSGPNFGHVYYMSLRASSSSEVGSLSVQNDSVGQVFDTDSLEDEFRSCPISYSGDHWRYNGGLKCEVSYDHHDDGGGGFSMCPIHATINDGFLEPPTHLMCKPKRAATHDLVVGQMKLNRGDTHRTDTNRHHKIMIYTVPSASNSKGEV